MNLEIITAENADRIEVLGQDLANSYKIAFAGPPWNEVSRCTDAECQAAFTELLPGCACPDCGESLSEAYDTQELIAGWLQIISAESGLVEVELLPNNTPVRATIARPTTPQELFARKYDAQSMKPWLQATLPPELVWIEDTFANRDIRPTGNLKERRATLEQIQEYYAGLAIATRTLTPQVVAATARAVGESTTLFVGTEKVGLDCSEAFTRVATVPDKRSLMLVALGGKL